MADPSDANAALERLDEITRRLRRECPWDREQDARSIVPHTVEEAGERAVRNYFAGPYLRDELLIVLGTVLVFVILRREVNLATIAALHDGITDARTGRRPCGASAVGSAASKVTPAMPIAPDPSVMRRSSTSSPRNCR